MSLTNYTVSVDNTNDENSTKVFSSTIPGGEWADNEIVDYLANVLQKQNSGASTPCLVQLLVQGKSFTASNALVANNANTGKHFITGRLLRVGDDVYVAAKGSNSILSAPSATDDFSGTAGNGAILTGVDFDSDIEIALYVDWGTPTNVEYDVVSGKLWKF